MKIATKSYLKPFEFPLCLAPMVGLSHVVLRKVIFDYMPMDTETFWPTEMLNSRRVPHEKLGFTAETLLFEGEKNLVPQILGNEKDAIQKTIHKMIHEWSDDADAVLGIDINMGCPVQKALKHNYGVALMGDVDYAAAVVDFAATASKKPVSVKLRAVGSEKSIPELIHFVEKLKNAGASWITLHPRTAAQKRKGTADWNQITELKKVLNIPVVGNGDVQTVDDAIAMQNQTGCDVVMSGRGLAARPWMMWQLGDKLGLTPPAHLKNRRVPTTDYEEGAEYGISLLNYIKWTNYYFGEKVHMKPDLMIRKILFYVKTTHVWLEFGHTLMTEVSRAKSLSDMETRVENFFKNPQRMFAYTELRQ